MATLRRHCGLAMVEFAIVLPTLFLIFSLFWDQMMVQMSKLRHEAASIQLALNFTDSALTASINTSLPIPAMQLSKIGVNNIDDLILPPNGYLPRMNTLFVNLMNNIGTGSQYVTNNIAIRLVYFRICDDLTLPACSGKVLGGAYAAEVAGAGSDYPTPAPQLFFTAPSGDQCFGAPGSPTRVKIENDFDNYVRLQRVDILSAASDATWPFGIKIIDVPAAAGIGAIEVHLRLRPVFFFAVCSDPPQLISSDPVVSFQTSFPDETVTF